MSLAPHYRHRGLLLLPERAVLNEDARTLFVADVHLGKAASFRRLGAPAPAGTTRENLDRLDALIEKYGAARLVFLGDLFHAKAERTPAIVEAFGLWRRRRTRVGMVLVRGNHDIYDENLPQTLDLEVEAEPHFEGQLECRHLPLAPWSEDGRTTLSGHIHPYSRALGRARDHLRLPCFLLRGREIVLPAFGEFTSGVTVTARDGARVIATDDGVAAI